MSDGDVDVGCDLRLRLKVTGQGGLGHSYVKWNERTMVVR